MTERLSVIADHQAAHGVALPALASFAFTGDQLRGAPAPPRPWHVPQMVPQRAVTLLQGDGGTGKSLLALQLAASTALAARWLGREVRAGRVLYLSAEDDRDELHRRLDAVTLEHGAGLADLGDLKALDLAGQDAVLAEADKTGRLRSTGRWDELVGLAATWAPALIVIDNLADVFAGEENSRPQARQFVGMLHGLARDCDAAVLLIGHPSLSGIASGTGSSGSTAWNNSVRSRLYLTRDELKDGEGDPEARTLKVMKANYGPANLEVRLRWAAGAFSADDSGAPVMGAVDKRIAENRAEAKFLELLDAFDAQGRIVSDSTGRNYAPNLFAKDPRADGIAKRGFESAMSRLFAAGQLRITEVGKGSHARRKLVRDGQ